MIDNLIFKKAEKRLNNALKYIRYDASLAKKEFNKNLSENNEILEIDAKIADCEADIEKYSNRILQKFKEISKEVFFADDKELHRQFEDSMFDVRIDSDKEYGGMSVNECLNLFKLDKFTAQYFKNNITKYPQCIDLDNINDIEFFLRTIPEKVDIESYVDDIKKELETGMKVATKIKNIAKSRLNKLNKVLSACYKMNIKNKNLISKANNKIEEYSSLCESYFKFMSAALTIEDKLKYEVKAFNEMVKLASSTNLILYKNAVKVKDAHIKYKENLLENIKENSKEYKHINKIRSEENINNFVKNCISNEEIRALKRDPKFMFELGKANKTKIDSRATRLLVNYLSEKLVPQQQEVSK